MLSGFLAGGVSRSTQDRIRAAAGTVLEKLGRPIISPRPHRVAFATKLRGLDFRMLLNIDDTFLYLAKTIAAIFMAKVRCCVS